jgi:uncharacterized protein
MTAMTQEPEVTDNRDQSQFEIGIDGSEAELIYRVRAGRLVLVHTGVPDELGGRGVGTMLMQAALAKSTAEGLTIVPLCPFARRWLERHPDATAGVTIDWTQAS